MTTITEWDESGRPSQWVVETETEFSADERESWYALHELRQATCPHCGNLRAICSSPGGLDGHGIYPQLDRCWVTAAREVNDRRWRDKHKNAKPDGGYLPTDGAFVWASPVDHTPEDDPFAD